jgi:hypothetical protein
VVAEPDWALGPIVTFIALGLLTAPWLLRGYGVYAQSLLTPTRTAPPKQPVQNGFVFHAPADRFMAVGRNARHAAKFSLCVSAVTARYSRNHCARSWPKAFAAVSYGQYRAT